jgi:hypothetical protein
MEMIAITTKQDAYNTLLLLRAEHDGLAEFDATTSHVRKEYTDRIAAHEERLRTWALANLPSGSRTVDLLVGKVSFKKQPSGYRIVDKVATLAWVKESTDPEVFRALKVDTKVTESVDAKILLALVPGFIENDPIGGVPPGVQLVEAEDRFYIEFDAEAATSQPPREVALV